VANNLATADFILHSKFMDQEYVHWIEDYEKQAQNRAEAFKK
jgi:methylglyoxal synthase